MSLLVLVFSGIDSGACCQIPLVVGFQTPTLVAYSRQGRDRAGVDLSRNCNCIQNIGVGAGSGVFGGTLVHVSAGVSRLGL